MSYLVLARKYRPSTFAEVVGQEHVTRTLGNAFAAGRVHHAFLFCGPRGCGKTTLARIVGKALNCQAEPRTPEPCGVCSACVSINNGSATDYQEMDGASNRGIDAIRELTEAVRYQPAVLRKKVYVIDEVHMLTTEAFNALLKTLEEPPPHVTFVLATTEPHKLPNTILSRCQRYDFKLVPASRLAQHLTGIFGKEQLSIEQGAVSLIVRESGGSVRDALSLCDQLISYVGDQTMTERHVAEVLGVADRSLTRALVRALASGDAGEALGAVESAIERGVDEVQLARAIVRYLRDLSVLQVAPGRRGLIDATDEELGELSAEASALDRSRVTQMFERMLRCCDELGKTLQPRLVLDCALIDVATIEPLVPLGDLIERLGELESRLAGKPARAGGSGGGTRPRPPAPPAPAPRAPAPVRSAPDARSAPEAATRSTPVAAPPSSSSSSAPSSSSSSAPSSSSSFAPSSSSSSAPSSSSSSAPSVAASVSASSVAASASASSVTAPPTSAPSAPAVATPVAVPAVATPVSAPSVSTPALAPSVAASALAPSVAASASAPSVAAKSPSASPPAAPSMAAPAPVAAAPSVAAAARVEAAPVATNGDSQGHERSAPVSMQPSGPVPRPAATATGSGPHDDSARRLAVPESSDAALRAWQDVLAELEALRKFSLLGPYQHARVMAWTADRLELGFPFDDHSMGEMAKDRADELAAIVRTLGPAQKNVRVSVRLLDAGESQTAGARSILETTREKTTAERTKREAEARAHPITKHVLQTFGAQIKEIKTDV